MRIWDYLIVVSAFCFILYFIYQEGEKNGYNERENVCNEEVIKVQQKTMEEARKLYIRKNANRAAPITDNIAWLQKHLCKNCNDK